MLSAPCHVEGLPEEVFDDDWLVYTSLFVLPLKYSEISIGKI